MSDINNIKHLSLESQICVLAADVSRANKRKKSLEKYIYCT